MIGSGRIGEAFGLRRIPALFSLLLAVSPLLLLTGCATTEDEQTNYSERPWNTPRDWETGLPSMMNQGR